MTQEILHDKLNHYHYTDTNYFRAGAQRNTGFSPDFQKKEHIIGLGTLTVIAAQHLHGDVRQWYSCGNQKARPCCYMFFLVVQLVLTFFF